MQVARKTSPHNDKGHVAVFAFPFHGQLPAPALFDLTTKLATATPCTLFSFFGTAKSIHNLLSTTKSNGYSLPGNLKAYSTWVDGLPAEGYNGKLPFNDALKGEAKVLLENLSGNFKSSVKLTVEDRKREITCFITDASLALEVDKLAQEMNLPWVAFSAVAPHTLSAFFHLHLIRRTYVYDASDHYDKLSVSFKGQNMESIPGLSIFRVEDLSTYDVFIKEEEDKVSFDASSRLNRNLLALPRASAVVFCCYEELNPNLLNTDLKSKFKRLLYVGALKLSLPPPPILSEDDNSGSLSWLDEQNPGSVAYVSFGTEGNPSHDEMVALAEALEASGVPFLWSIKEMSEREHFPDGFLERINSKTNSAGRVVLWAPQRQVLAHSSTGVCISHCGYDSVMESVVGEVSMIVRPIWTDNYLCARLVEDVWSIGIKVEGGVFTKNGMLKCLEKVFGDQRKSLLENVKALKQVVTEAAGPCGSAARGLKHLVDLISRD